MSECMCVGMIVACVCTLQGFFDPVLCVYAYVPMCTCIYVHIYVCICIYTYTHQIYKQEQSMYESKFADVKASKFSHVTMLHNRT
jgi:hypothetical protein